MVPGSAAVTSKPLEGGVGATIVAFIDGNARYEIENRIAMAATGISTTPRMSTAQVSVGPDRVAG